MQWGILTARDNPFQMQGITPLFIASQERHVSVVRALLKGKADPNRRNKVCNVLLLL